MSVGSSCLQEARSLETKNYSPATHYRCSTPTRPGSTSSIRERRNARTRTIRSLLPRTATTRTHVGTIVHSRSQRFNRRHTHLVLPHSHLLQRRVDQARFCLVYRIDRAIFEEIYGGWHRCIARGVYLALLLEIGRRLLVHVGRGHFDRDLV